MRSGFLGTGVLGAIVACAGASVVSAGVSTSLSGEKNYLRMPGGSAQAEVDRATQQFEKGDGRQAFETLKAAAAAHPDLFPARLMLAKLYLRKNQRAEGRANLELAAAESPDLPETYLVFGNLALEEGRLADAWLHFKQAAAVTPSSQWSDDLKRSFLIDANAGLAAVAEARRDWPSAETALAAQLKLVPSDGKTRQRLARVMFHLGKRDKVFEELKRAAKDDSSLEPAGTTVGWLFAEERDSKRAEQWLSNAVKDAPNEPKAHLGFAAWLLEQDRLESAQAEVEAAAKLTPDSFEVRRLQGQVAWHLKEFEKAERAFESLHLEAPGDLSASNQLALALAEQPEPAKRQRALQLAEMNARLDPSNSEALVAFGRISYRLGRSEDAERAFRAALAQGRISPDGIFYYARLLDDLGRLGEIQPLLQAAIDSPGRFAYRNEARTLAKKLASAGKAN